MATTADYLTQLQSDKQALVDNLNAKGVTASGDETFTSLVPKVLEIESGGGSGAEVYTPEFISFKSYGGTSLENATKNIDTSNITTMEGIFAHCTNLKSLNLDGWSMASTNTMDSMFYNCSALLNLYLTNINTENVTDIDYLFYGCSSLQQLDLSHMDTSSVIAAKQVFYNCSSLTTIVINRDQLFKITNANSFTNSGIANGICTIYVPDDMVDSYKADTYWGAYPDQIKPISELPTE